MIGMAKWGRWVQGFSGTSTFLLFLADLIFGQVFEHFLYFGFSYVFMLL